MANTEKSTTRTTVTLEDDLKAWVEERAMRARRDFSAELNAVIEEARERANADTTSRR
jgi:hypothetical protein